MKYTRIFLLTTLASMIAGLITIRYTGHSAYFDNLVYEFTQREYLYDLAKDLEGQKVIKEQLEEICTNYVSTNNKPAIYDPASRVGIIIDEMQKNAPEKIKTTDNKSIYILNDKQIQKKYPSLGVDIMTQTKNIHLVDKLSKLNFRSNQIGVQYANSYLEKYNLEKPKLILEMKQKFISDCKTYDGKIATIVIVGGCTLIGTYYLLKS